LAAKLSRVTEKRVTCGKLKNGFEGDRLVANQGTQELKSLTSLRGLAAMAVVMQHFSATAQQYCRVPIPSLIPHGYVAVDFFFVLSGFIMSYTYLLDFRNRSLAAYRPFLAKRVARIVPLNVTVLGLLALGGGASFMVAGHNIFFTSRSPVLDFITNLLMLQGIGVGTNLNGPSWSISTEFAAYLLFPVFVFCMFGPRIRAAFAAIIAIAALCWLALLRPRLGLGFEAAPASLVRCFTEFSLGMMAYRLFEVPRVCAFFSRDSVTIGLSLAAVASLAARYDLPAVLLFPAIVVAYAKNNGVAGRIVQTHFFHFLGIVSYSVYLLHDMFRPLELNILRMLAPEPVGPTAALIFALVGSFSVVPFAWLAYVTVERPGREFVRALFASAAPRRPYRVG
jgi:peptidoglycan/LPS O-acetylase OafA/YrhL